MKLAVEKNLNKCAFPIFSVKGRSIEHPVLAKYKQAEVLCHSGMFDARSWMLLDILGTCVIHRFYNWNEGKINFEHRVPTERDHRVKRLSGKMISYRMLQHVMPELIGTPGEIPDYLTKSGGIDKKVDKINTSMKPVRNVTISDSFIKQQVPFMKKYTSGQIHQMFSRLAELKQQMVYSVRFFDGKKYQNHPFSTDHYPYNFFSLTNIKNERVASNGNILERSYTISFNTVLGHFFVQNCLSCYCDLLPEKFYSMSDYAQLFYRMLILPYYDGNKIPMGIEEIRTRLQLKTPDTYMVRGVIKRILDELESNAFIRKPEELKLYGEYQYSYVKCSWHEITHSEEYENEQGIPQELIL